MDEIAKKNEQKIREKRIMMQAKYQIKQGKNKSRGLFSGLGNYSDKEQNAR